MRTVCVGLNLAGATAQGRSGSSPRKEALTEQRASGSLSVRTAEGARAGRDERDGTSSGLGSCVFTFSLW